MVNNVACTSSPDFLVGIQFFHIFSPWDFNLGAFQKSYPYWWGLKLNLIFFVRWLILFYPFSFRFGSRGKEESDASVSAYKVRSLSVNVCLVIDFLVLAILDGWNKLLYILDQTKPSNCLLYSKLFIWVTFDMYLPITAAVLIRFLIFKAVLWNRNRNRNRRNRNILTSGTGTVTGTVTC